MSGHPLARLAWARARGRPEGITSVCSAHPLVIEAACLQARGDGGPALVEATCNQVNQEGGYTGMTPADFRDRAFAIADRVGLPRDRIILGGDHLGPNPWRKLAAETALARAEAMIAGYVGAGFAKIHLDASMPCGDDPPRLDDGQMADRAARLAAVAERAAADAGCSPPCYVIGTEVPTPGGAAAGHGELAITSPAAVAETVELHRQAFRSARLDLAFERVVALVVQPGVEFGHEDVTAYAPPRARGLSASLRGFPDLVFEAHSTDYQAPEALTALVADGFAILKVGPALTFAMREALYALDDLASALDPAWRAHSLRATMERLMLAQPDHWRPYCVGSPEDQHRQRHTSYSDRIRYYWPSPEAEAVWADLVARLEGAIVPEGLRGPGAAWAGDAPGARLQPREFALAAIGSVLRRYAQACRPADPAGGIPRTS